MRYFYEYLHYTLLLLIPTSLDCQHGHLFNLHYTLLLLIQSKGVYGDEMIMAFTLHFATINTRQFLILLDQLGTFTLHFATINTMIGMTQVGKQLYLHYTLLLLIRLKRQLKQKELIDLHYTLLLLIPPKPPAS